MVWATKTILFIIHVQISGKMLKLWLINFNFSIKLIDLWLVVTGGVQCEIE